MRISAALSAIPLFVLPPKTLRADNHKKVRMFASRELRRLAQGFEASGRASPGALRASLSVNCLAALDVLKAAGLANHSLRLLDISRTLGDTVFGKPNLRSALCHGRLRVERS
jgi:hypothetical protein